MNPPLMKSAAPRVECSRGHDLTDPANRVADARYHGCRACKRDRDRRADKRRRLARIDARVYETATAIPAPTRNPNRERMDSELLVTETTGVGIADGPLIVTRADGVECYRIDEWFRRFGRPGVFHTILEDDR